MIRGAAKTTEAFTSTTNSPARKEKGHTVVISRDTHGHHDGEAVFCWIDDFRALN